MGNLNEVYHIAIMPCHDKKLEASRNIDIDLVLTTHDIITLIQQKSYYSNIQSFFFSLSKQSKSSNHYSNMLLHPNVIPTTPFIHNHPYVYSSGGYADYIFRHACKHIFNYNIPNHIPLPWTSISSTNTTTTNNNNIIKRKTPRRKNKDFFDLCL